MTDETKAPKDAPAGDTREAPEAPGTPAPRTYSEEEVAALLAAKEAEAQDRHMRLAAEYQNFRRRTEREKDTLQDEALERFVKDLLPVLDSFERAVALQGKDPVAAASGIEVTDRQLRGVLERNGITPIEAAGRPFDPRVHEAIVRTPTSDAPAGTVLSALETGWQMRSRLLRAARVQVAAAKD